MAKANLETMTLPIGSRRARWLEAVLRFARQRPLGAIGAVIILVMILAALLAGWIAPFDPLVTNYTAMLQAPSPSHWFGTDSFGRDVFTRILYGSRTALWIGFASALLGATLGAIIGVTSAYFGGKIDLILQRLMDLLLSFPLIILALVVVTLLGTGTINVILAIMVPMVPRCALVVRSSALALREMPFVEAARALGFGPVHIILRHMLPNVMAPFLIMLTAFLRTSDPFGSIAFFSWSRRRRTSSRLGLNVARSRRGVCRTRPVDGNLSWLSDKPFGLCLQSFW
jgi:peptide/nickel transport system permease protein